MITESGIDAAIADLTTATDHLERALAGGDWPLAERLQKRRQALVGWLADQGPEQFAPAQAASLRVLKAREDALGARIAALRDEAGQAIGGNPAEPGRRMRRAYRLLDTRH